MGSLAPLQRIVCLLKGHEWMSLHGPGYRACLWCNKTMPFRAASSQSRGET